jgi:hypothetical protein
MPFAALAVNTLICWSPFMCPSSLGLGGVTDESALTRGMRWFVGRWWTIARSEHPTSASRIACPFRLLRATPCPARGRAFPRLLPEVATAPTS